MGEDTRQKNKHRKPQIKVARGSLNFHEKQLIHRSSVGFNKRRDVRLQVILGTHFIGRVTDGCGEERRVLTKQVLAVERVDSLPSADAPSRALGSRTPPRADQPGGVTRQTRVKRRRWHKMEKQDGDESRATTPTTRDEKRKKRA